MHIRTMTLRDAAAVARLATQLGYPSSAAEIERRFRLVEDDPDHGLLVAEAADGQVVGWVHIHGRLLLEAEPFAEIGGLVVDEACRGQGTGRALVAAAEHWAREHGYAEVCVRSNVVRKEAHRFYEGLGYQLVKSQLTFRKALQPHCAHLAD